MDDTLQSLTPVLHLAVQEDAPETLRVVQAASEGAFAPAPSHKDARSEFYCLAQDFTD